MTRLLSILCLILPILAACGGAKVKPPVSSTESAQLASLIDPANLSTLGERGANPRIQKAVAILLVAKSNGQEPERIVADSITRIGWAGTLKGELTAESLLRNVTIAERLGTTTPADIEAMRKGNLPLTLNKRKQDKIGERQIALGRKFKEAGFLTRVGQQNQEIR